MASSNPRRVITPTERFKTFAADVAVGKYNGKLIDCIEACRAAGNGRRVHWRVNFAGVDITSLSMRPLEIRWVEQHTGTTWRFIRPDMSGSMAVAILTAHLHLTCGLSVDDAEARINNAGTADELISSISEFEVDEAAPLAQP